MDKTHGVKEHATTEALRGSAKLVEVWKGHHHWQIKNSSPPSSHHRHSKLTAQEEQQRRYALDVLKAREDVEDIRGGLGLIRHRERAQERLEPRRVLEGSVLQPACDARRRKGSAMGVWGGVQRRGLARVRWDRVADYSPLSTPRLPIPPGRQPAVPCSTVRPCP
jgi:hypothetical protein